MTISELIKELENIQKEQGDIDVVVQYRDEGGIYDGCDEEIDLDLGEHYNLVDKKVRRCVIL